MSNPQKKPKRKFKHIVITGASSGIGEALALYYAAPNVMLSLNGRHQERLEKVAQNCRSQGANVHIELLCVTNQKAMKNWLLHCDKKQAIDLLIANAGISGGTGNQHHETPEQIREIFSINLNGVLNTIDPILPQMRERGYGHIALMSSLASFRGFPGAPAYCASKAAIRIYGESLSAMLENTNIHIHVICPGFITSRITEKNTFPMPFLISAEKAAKIIAKGIDKKHSRIAFPQPTAFFAWLLGALPNYLSLKLTKNAPTKNTTILQ